MNFFLAAHTRIYIYIYRYNYNVYIYYIHIYHWFKTPQLIELLQWIESIYLIVIPFYLGAGFTNTDVLNGSDRHTGAIQPFVTACIYVVVDPFFFV